MIKKDTVNLDVYLLCLFHIMFEAGAPLTQEEIIKRGSHIYNKRWWTLKKQLRRAEKIGSLAVQKHDDRIVYYPKMTYEEFLACEEKIMKEIMSDPDCLRHTTFHALPKEMTIEEYNKIKKMIDELE